MKTAAIYPRVTTDNQETKGTSLIGINQSGRGLNSEKYRC